MPCVSGESARTDRWEWMRECQVALSHSLKNGLVKCHDPACSYMISSDERRGRARARRTSAAARQRGGRGRACRARQVRDARTMPRQINEQVLVNSE